MAKSHYYYALIRKGIEQTSNPSAASIAKGVKPNKYFQIATSSILTDITMPDGKVVKGAIGGDGSVRNLPGNIFEGNSAWEIEFAQLREAAEKKIGVLKTRIDRDGTKYEDLLTEVPILGYWVSVATDPFNIIDADGKIKMTPKKVNGAIQNVPSIANQIWVFIKGDQEEHEADVIKGEIAKRVTPFLVTPTVAIGTESVD